MSTRTPVRRPRPDSPEAGATVRVGLIGKGIQRSKSPAMHEAEAAAQGFRCVYVHRAVLYHMVAYTTGGYSPGRNFQFGRSSALYVRRYGRPWNWISFLGFSFAAFAVAYLRELRKGNQAAAVAKIQGLREGLKTDPRPQEVLRAKALERPPQ